jgi:hypothetical protein
MSRVDSSESIELRRKSWQVSSTRWFAFTEFGPTEVLRVENGEVRESSSGEVRIKVAAIGMNFAESLWRRNQYLESRKRTILFMTLPPSVRVSGLIYLQTSKTPLSLRASSRGRCLFTRN